MKKICVITGSRAEYGLFYWLLKKIQKEKTLELQIICSGMHLSPEFGLTFKEIEKDGFKINKKVEMLLSADTPSSISKSTALGIIGFSDAYDDLNPDIVVVLGDRFETLSACIAATFARIPIAHFHGGESTEGLIDEPIRHSITKMSHLHFVATKEYLKRVVQMGEDPKTVFNIGGMGIDNIKKINLMKLEQLQKDLNFNFAKKNLLITFHPVTLEKSTASSQFKNLLKSLDCLKDTNFIFTKPNADTDGRIIIKLIDSFVEKNKHRSISFINMGQHRFLSALKYVDAIVGNSSCGLLEAPSFKIATINIGDRQKGRIKAESVIDTRPHKSEISNAINNLYEESFQNKLKDVKNPYGEGGASKRAVEILKNSNFDNLIFKKFYDM